MLSRRDHIAAMVLQGILSGSRRSSDAVEDAVIAADLLIAKLDEVPVDHPLYEEYNSYMGSGGDLPFVEFERLRNRLDVLSSVRNPREDLREERREIEYKLLLLY